MNEHRKFYRHPTEIPVEIWEASPQSKHHYQPLNNVSVGGLAFICTHQWPISTLIQLRLPSIKPAFEALVKVVWSRKRLNYFEIGVMFISEEDAFRGRMVEQVCQIEIYRQKKQAEGESLSAEEAAMEWIDLYAERFDSHALHYRHHPQIH